MYRQMKNGRAGRKASYPFPLPFHDVIVGKGGLGKRVEDAQCRLPALPHLDVKDPPLEGGWRRWQKRLVTDSFKLIYAGCPICPILLNHIISRWWEKSLVEIGSS